MAGIGFQLKNLVKDNSVFGGVKAFAFSSIIVAGPMIICILLITLAQVFLQMMNAPYFERELFLAGTLYSFVFSQVFTGGFSMLLNRFLADQIFSGEEDNILSSLFGVLATVLFIGGGIGLVFCSLSSLDLVFKGFFYLFFIELMVIWLLSIYISALKKYMQIVYGFLIGATTASAAIWFCYDVLHIVTAAQMIACIDLGFFITILLFSKSIKEKFPVNNKKYFNFLGYLQKYPSLFFIGLLYTIGLYGHSFIVWGSKLQTVVSKTFVIAPLYDIPVFYAYLTIIPAVIMFVVSVETSFFKRYKAFYSKVLGSASYKEIKDAQSKMFSVLSSELTFIMEFQLFFTVCAIALGTRLLPITIEQVDIFNIIAIGNYFFIMMFIVLQILLYFDDRKGALLVICSNAAAILVLTPIGIIYESYGLSCFIAGMIGLGASLGRLYYFGKNFGYFTYCSQPMVLKKEKVFMKNFAEKLNSLNGSAGGKYETEK